MNLETQQNSDAGTSPFLQFKQLQNNQVFDARTKNKIEEKNQLYQNKYPKQSRSIENRVKYTNQPSSSFNSSKDVNKSSRTSFKEHILEKQLKQQMQQQQKQSSLSIQMKRSKFRENHSLTLFTQYKQQEKQQLLPSSSPKILPSSLSIQYQQQSGQILPNMLNVQHRSQSTENQLPQSSKLLLHQPPVGSDKTQLLFESYFVDSAYGKTQNDFAVLRQLKTGNDIETQLSLKRKQSLAEKIDLLLPKRPQTQQDIKSTASWRGESREDNFSPSKTQPSWVLNLGPALKNVIFKSEENNVISQGILASTKVLPMEIYHDEKISTKIVSNPMTSLSKIQAEFDRRSTSEHVGSNSNFYITNKDHYQPTAIKLIQHVLLPRQQQLLEEQLSSPRLVESSSSSSSPYHMKQKYPQKQDNEQELLKEVDGVDKNDQCKSKTVKLLNLQEIPQNENQQDFRKNEVYQKLDDMECSLKDELKASPIDTKLSQQAFFPQTKNPNQNSQRNVNNIFPNILPLNNGNSSNLSYTPNGEYFSNPLIMLKTQSKNTNYTNTTRAFTTTGVTQSQRKNSINTTSVVINNNNNISISPSPRSIKQQQSFHLTSRKEKIRPAIQTYLNSRARHHPVMSQRDSISSQEEPPLFLKISSIKTASSSSKNQQTEIVPKKERFSPEKYLVDKHNKPLENKSAIGTNAISNVLRLKGKQSKEGKPVGRNQNEIIPLSGQIESQLQLDFVPRSQSFTELSRKTLSSFHQYQANKTNQTDANSEEVFPLPKNTPNGININADKKNIKIQVISPGGEKKSRESNQNQKQFRTQGTKDLIDVNNSLNKLQSPNQKRSNAYRNQQTFGEQARILEEQTAMNTQGLHSSQSFVLKTNKNNDGCSIPSNQISPRAVIDSNNMKQMQRPKVLSKQFTQIINGRDITPNQHPSKQQHTSGSQLIRVQTVPSIGRDTNQNYFEDLPKKPIKIIQMSAMEQSSLSPLQKQQKQLQQHKADSQQLLQNNQQQLSETQTTEDSPFKNSIIPMYIRNYSSMQSRNDNSIIYGNIKDTDVSLECIEMIEDNIDEIKIHLLKGFSQNKNLVELVREFCLIPQEEFIAEMMRFFKFVLEAAKKKAKDQLAQEEKIKSTFSLAKEKKDVLLEEQSALNSSNSGSPRSKLLSLKKAAQLIKTANGAIQKMGFTFNHEKDPGHGSMKFQIIPKIILDYVVNELHMHFRELKIPATEGFFAQYVHLAINNLLPHSLYQELGSERGIRNFIGLVIEKLHEELDFELTSLTNSFEIIFNTVQAIVQNDFTLLQSLLSETTTLKLTSVEFYLLKNVIIEVFFAQHRAATSSKEHNNSNNSHTTPITQQSINHTPSQKQPELAVGIQDFTKYYNEIVLANNNSERNNKNMNSSQLFAQQQKIKNITSNQPSSSITTTSNKIDQQSSEKLSKQQRAAAATRISRQLFAAEDGCVNRYTRNEILERVEVTRAIILRRSKPIEDPRIISEICFMIAQDRAFLKHRRGQLASLRSIEAFLTELSSVLFSTREKREGFIASQQKLIGYILDIPFWESLKDAYLSVMRKPQNKYLSSRAFLIDLELRFYYILVDANLLERPVFSLLENTAQLVEELFLWVEDQHFQLGNKFSHDLILSYDRRCMTFFLQDAMLYGVYSALDTEYALLYFKIQPDIVQLWMRGIKSILSKPIFQLTPTQQTELTVFLQNLIPID